MNDREANIMKFIAAVILTAVRPTWDTTHAVKAAKRLVDEFDIDEADKPFDMVLHCPKCITQHVDKPRGEWKNPPHRSHLCAKCGFVWRPADVATNGIMKCATRGEHDGATAVNMSEEDIPQ